MLIPATHVGSLPRPQEVVDFLFARESARVYDPAAFDACMAAAVMENVRRQKEAGIDIVSDGEASKISYATYVKNRYTGLDGDSPRNAPADLKLFPSFLDRLAKEGGTPKYARPQCVGPVASKGQGELGKDIANLKSAMAAHGVHWINDVSGFRSGAAMAAAAATPAHVHFVVMFSRSVGARADRSASEPRDVVGEVRAFFSPIMKYLRGKMSRALFPTRWS